MSTYIYIYIDLLSSPNWRITLSCRTSTNPPAPYEKSFEAKTDATQRQTHALLFHSGFAVSKSKKPFKSKCKARLSL